MTASCPEESVLLTAPPPVLQINNYSLAYETSSGPIDVLKSISLKVAPAQTVALVGESGSGKSSLAWAIMRYLPGNAVEKSGRILLSGDDLIAKNTQQIQEIRGKRISMVFQDPSTSLNPAIRLGDQLAEVLVRHRRLTRRQALAEAEAALARTGIAKPIEMMRRYPHEASGGEKQRVVIATAFACNPELIVFDEPTTALDILTARQILELFVKLREETGVAALYISHDLGLVSRIADNVSVLQRGTIVESGKVAEVFRAPIDPYTVNLLEAVPRPDKRIGVPAPAAGVEPLLELQDVSVRYGSPSLLSRMFDPGAKPFFGAANISLEVRPGELLGIVGESGSGKSTIARALTGLKSFDGCVRYAGRTFLDWRDFDRSYRRAVQIVFQHPDASLNPRQRIGEILTRPLKLYNIVPREQRAAQVRSLLKMVLLPADYADRYPHQLSGGEKQRVAIARAFAANPDLVICDEITAALDVSVQASVARLLIDLQRDTGTACIFITHDLNLVRQLAHRIAVMQRGRLVDLFDVGDARSEHRHPYTKALLDAVPVPMTPAPEIEETA